MIVQQVGRCGAIDERVERGALAATNLAGEGDHADAVAGQTGDACKRKRCGHRIVELALPSLERGVISRPQSSNEHHVLAALDLVLRDHQISAPRRRLPIDRSGTHRRRSRATIRTRCRRRASASVEARLRSTGCARASEPYRSTAERSGKTRNALGASTAMRRRSKPSAFSYQAYSGAERVGTARCRGHGALDFTLRARRNVADRSRPARTATYAPASRRCRRGSCAPTGCDAIRQLGRNSQRKMTAAEPFDADVAGARAPISRRRTRRCRAPSRRRLPPARTGDSPARTPQSARSRRARKESAASPTAATRAAGGYASRGTGTVARISRRTSEAVIPSISASGATIKPMRQDERTPRPSRRRASRTSRPSIAAAACDASSSAMPARGDRAERQARMRCACAATMRYV